MECQICFESFDTNNFVPKMLVNCGHSFCKICLERLINKRTFVNCPICRELTTLKYKTKNSLPTNYNLIEIIDKKHVLDQSKSVLEKYKYFDSKSYSQINQEIIRHSDPKKLILKKIINEDFIYVEEFQNNENISIFNSFTKRNRRYNFNRYSFLSWFFNEYSYFISVYRKSSKCNHNFSCLESILRKIFYLLSICLLMKYPLKSVMNSKYVKEYISSSGVSSDNIVKYTQYSMFGFMAVSKVFSCLVGFYVDDLINIVGV